jgi:hypothetical protein
MGSATSAWAPRTEAQPEAGPRRIAAGCWADQVSRGTAVCGYPVTRMLRVRGASHAERLQCWM